MKDKNYNPIEYLTGFVMGVIAGVPLEFLLFFLYTVIARWQGWELLEPAWWMAVPIPLVFGFILGSAIAGLHLEDY